MSDVKFYCPKCKQPLEAPEDMLGQTVDCPSCNTRIQIPQSQPKATPVVRTTHQSISKPRSKAHTQTQHRGTQTRPKLIFVFSALAIVIVALAVTIGVFVNRQTRPGSVEGGAWVIKGGGQSDVLRGLTVYIMNADIDSTSIEAPLRKLCVDMRELIPPPLAKQNFAKECGEKIDNILTSKSRPDLRTLYELVRTVQKNAISDTEFFLVLLEHDAIWPSILGSALLHKGQTGIDGKYTIPDIMPGEYFLYAQASSSFYFVEWFLPVKVTSGQPTKIDLFNENTALTINKE